MRVHLKCTNNISSLGRQVSLSERWLAHYIFYASIFTFSCACVAMMHKETQYLCFDLMGSLYIGLLTYEHGLFRSLSLYMIKKICVNRVNILYLCSTMHVLVFQVIIN